MGYQIYIGLYVHCKIADATIVREVATCSLPKCSHYEDESKCNFCNYCGSKILKRNRQEVVKYVDTNTVQSELYRSNPKVCLQYSNVLNSNKEHIWIICGEDALKRDIHFGNFNRLLEIEANKISVGIADFSLKYRDQIEILKSKYGAECVNVHWGLLGQR